MRVASTVEAMGHRNSRFPIAGAAAAAVLLAACGPVEELRERIRGVTPHEDYVERLRAAGLMETALARDWTSAAEQALRTPLAGSLPIEETGYLDAQRATAVSLRVPLQRGQRIYIDADLLPDSSALLFVDVFRAPADTLEPPLHVAAADSGARSLELDPSRTGDYIIRIQPELLRGGRYRLRVHSEPSLTFPVEGVGEPAIGSRFGAPRDGGARSHHGIDIFAPRGTPVLAGTAAVVSRVQETPRGGRVVWLRDQRRGNSLYYAHLDTQLVSSGQHVEPGDTIGTVGNTGNARTTPPHLHFGIYRRGEGPVDPIDFVKRLPTTPPRLTADTALLGGWARVYGGTVIGADGGEAALDVNAAVFVRGASGSRYRVELPDGTPGWIAATTVAPGSVASLQPSTPCTLRDAPTPQAAEITTIPSGTSITVIGRFGDYALVRKGGIDGWSDCA